jgi:UDPglucose 6-dehydrogenase
MRLAILGTGYVGLVTGTCFSDFGNTVVCIDKDAAKVEGLRQGRIPIYEPGLQELVERNTREGRLSFTTDLPSGIKGAEVVFICVGTPQAADGSADLSIVFEVVRSIRDHVDGPKIVVIKSTVPVGTNDEALEILKDARHPVRLASNPEFLKEGAAIDD